MKKASTDTQVIVATQSSLLLDDSNRKRCWWPTGSMAPREFTPLEPTLLESWLEDYSLGQLWEKNELGGRPTPEPD